MKQQGRLDRPRLDYRTRTQCLEQWCIPPPRRETCVVFLDSHTTSEHALSYALAFARRSGDSSRIVLATSVRSRSRFGNLAAEALDRQQSAAWELRQRIGSQVTTVAIEGRDTAQSILAIASDADLTIMASQGRGLLQRACHDSVIHQLIRQLPCPLLLIPSEEGLVNLVPSPIVRNVVIPLDGTLAAERAVDALAATGLARDAQCTLTHIQDLDQLFGRSLGDARAYLHGAASRVKDRLTRVNTEFVIGLQRVAPAILSIAEEQRCDLIALTTQARSGLARILRPSTAAHIIRHADIPILLCGPANRMHSR